METGNMISGWEDPGAYRAPVILRPITAADAPALAGMHERSSQSSLYARYLRHHRPSFEELRALCTLPAHVGQAYVAVLDAPAQPIVGMGYYMVDPGAGAYTAEPALLVEDRYQNRGIGQQLFRRIGQQAARRGMQRFCSVIQANNKAIMAMIARAGFRYSTQFAYGVREITIWLEDEGVFSTGEFQRLTV